MVKIHRNNDIRADDTKTVVVGQNNVFLNNELISVENDICNIGGGNLNADNNPGNVFVNNKRVVYEGSSAKPNPKSKNPSAKAGSDNGFSL